MRNLGLAAVLLGGLCVAPVASAMAQVTNVAYAVEPRPDFVVFLDSGTNHLSAAAVDTVRAAADAAKAAPVVRLAGRADHAQAVKRELVRDGVPAASIIVSGQPVKQLPKAADGLAEPVNRRVEILF